MLDTSLWSEQSFVLFDADSDNFADLPRFIQSDYRETKWDYSDLLHLVNK